MADSASTVLMTGGAGFIGSELTAQLVAAGHRVIVLDNFSTGRRENLEGLPAGQLEIVEGDIRDLPVVSALLERAPLVFHLACVNLRQAMKTPTLAIDVNATATDALVAAAARSGVRRLVHVSTSEVYGSAERAVIDESHPTFPTTVYGSSKLAGETYARAAGAVGGMPTTIVRPFNSFGPRSHHEGTSGEVIPRFLLRALAARPLVVFGDGTLSRDFTYVSDTARGILLAGTTDAAIGRTINIGCGRETTINALADAVRHTTGRPDTPIAYLPSRPGDIQRQCADTTLARELLGFSPQVTFDEGLGRLFEWYRQLGVDPARLLEDEELRAWEGESIAE